MRKDHFNVAAMPLRKLGAVQRWADDVLRGSWGRAVPSDLRGLRTGQVGSCTQLRAMFFQNWALTPGWGRGTALATSVADRRALAAPGSLPAAEQRPFLWAVVFPRPFCVLTSMGTVNTPVVNL